jgi:hypothetical protein
VPEAIKAAVHQAMAKPQEERFPTVSAFIEALTGAPVSVIRAHAALPPSSPAGFDGTGPTSASGQTPHTGREAFDQTVSSGDHAVAPIMAPVDVAARTVDTENRPRSSAAAEGIASTIPSGQVALPATDAPRSRTPLVVAGVLAAGVAAAAIVYVVRREPPAPPSVASTVPPAVVIDAAVTKPAPPPVERALLDAPLERSGSAGPRSATEGPRGESIDAGVVDATVAVIPPDAAVKTAVPKPAPPTPPPPAQPAEPDDEDAADDSRVGLKLKEATAAIARGDWATASAAVRLVSTSEEAKPGQRAQATMLKGVIGCNTNDDDAALSAYRALPGRPKMRTRLLAACHRNGLLENLKR